MWELDCEESWALKNWCFWTVVLEKTLESPLDCKEIQPVHPKDQSWAFIGRTDVEAETPILWPPDAKSWHIGKDPDAGKDWKVGGEGDNGMRWLDSITDSKDMSLGKLRSWWWQGGLVCCSPWGHKSWTRLSDWTKGTFHAKMGSIKARNGMDLTEAEDIKKRWQEYTKELYKKDLHDLNNHDGVITQLEPDILECEVKWALGSITTNKASGGGWVPVEQFQILKDNAVIVLHSIWQQIWKTQQRPQDWKRSGFIPIPKKGNAKEYSNYHTVAFLSHASKVMLKFSKPGFNNTWTVNFQMFKLVLEKAEESEIKSPTSAGLLKKQESSRKTSISALLTMPKPLTVWVTTNCGKFWKRWEYQAT